MRTRTWRSWGVVAVGVVVIAALVGAVVVALGGDDEPSEPAASVGRATTTATSAPTTTSMPPPSKAVAVQSRDALAAIELTPLLEGSNALVDGADQPGCEDIRDGLAGLPPAQLVAVSGDVDDRPLGDALVEQRRAFDVALTACLGGDPPTADQLARLRRSTAALELRLQQIEEAAG